jgi:xylulokinase
MSLLGIDVGTSGCKAVLFAEDGRQISSAYAEYDYQSPQPGWAELDTPGVWEQVKATIRAAVAGEPGGYAKDPPRAVCVSSLGEAVVPVTANRQILGASLLNFDVRGAEYLPVLQEKISTEDLYRINGNTWGNHYSLPKLLWMKHRQPGIYQEADWLLHWSGFVAFMLGAEAAIDYSLANRSLLFDLEQEDWSSVLLRAADLAPGKLPPTLPGGVVIGTVAADIAGELNLPAGIPIVNGGHDQCCNALGCGVIEPGQAMYGMGTYICMTPVFDRRPPASAMIAQGLNTEHHLIPGQYVSFVYNQGGALVKWYRDTFAAAERKQAAETGADLYSMLTSEMPAAPSRVIALPYFTATGPPEFIEDACGVIAGLRLETQRGEILKGLMEATTFYIRECLESLPAEITISGFRAAGGGSNSDAWLQLCADIFGLPFQRPRVSEAGALGAAILAGAGSGVFSSIQQGVASMVHPGKTFEPDAQMQARYNERYALYRRLFPLLREYLREAASYIGVL